jgi:truncated hemoglobin YjbI
MASDTMLGFFFSSKDLHHIVLQQSSFLLRAMGQIKTYSGKSPGKAHVKIAPILQGHFDRRILLLRETLKEFSLTPGSIEIWASFEEQFRKYIVESEGPLSKRKVRL